jgi:hypothetical protein
MKFGIGVPAVAVALLATAVGCSSGSGIFGSNLPGGNLTITETATGKTLTTSATNPYLLLDNTLRFSISIAEDRFSGPYTVSIIKQQNLPTSANGGFAYPYSFNQPCFVPHNGSEFGAHANIVVFSGDNANSNPYNYPNGSTSPQPGVSPQPAATALPGGNPCHSGELETAQISDDKGHSTLFYYEELP